MLVTAAALDALRTSFRLEYNKSFAAAPILWDQIATFIPSSSASNTYGWIKDFPKMRRWLGDRVIKSIGEGTYAVANEEFEASFGVKRKMIEDDNLGIYGIMAAGLGQSAKEWPDELVFPLLANGSGALCWDGQNFFDDEHPLGDGNVAPATYSNIQGGSSAPFILMDTTRPLKPMIFQQRKAPEFVAMTQPGDESVFMRAEYRYGVDSRGDAGFGFPQMAFWSEAGLTTDNYDAAHAAMSTQVSEEGHKLNVKPNLILVGPSNRANAKTMFEAAQIDATSNVRLNDVKILAVPWLP
jgi:phage major head subunit gpT-like protein